MYIRLLMDDQYVNSVKASKVFRVCCTSVFVPILEAACEETVYLIGVELYVTVESLEFAPISSCAKISHNLIRTFCTTNTYSV